MIQISRWRVVLVVLSLILGVTFAGPNLVPADMRAHLPGFLRTSTINLGLDLRGGVQMMLQVDTQSLRRQRLEQVADSMTSALREARPRIDAAAASASSTGDVARIRIANPSETNRALALLRQTVGQSAGGESDRASVTFAANGGLIEGRLSGQATGALASEAVARSIEVLRNRIDPSGVNEITIVRQGDDRIVIQAPGETDPAALRARVGQTALLTFHLLREDVSPAAAQSGRGPAVFMPFVHSTGDDQEGVVVERRPALQGDALVNASAGFDPQTHQPVVNFRFDDEGARVFCRLTRANVGKPFAIALDNRILTHPVINEPICGGSGQISGHFTTEEVQELSLLLRAGSLPVPLTIEEERTIGAELGQDAIEAGQISTVLAFALVLIFMVLAYGLLFGGISVAALVLNGVLILAVMSLAGAALTLPGIAGLILTLAVALDANVLIYERMRDEVRHGKSPVLAGDAGFSRAIVTILDANATHLGAALIMFFLGAGPVKGFAWTLTIGVFTSVFTSVFVTQVLLAWWFRTVRPKHLPIAGSGIWPLIKLLPQKTNLRATSMAPYFGAVSLVACMAALLLTLTPFTPPCAGLNCGVDFRGGTVIEIATATAPIDLARLRSEIGDMRVGDVQVQAFADTRSALIRFETPEGADATETAVRVETRVLELHPDVQFQKREIVGPKVSGELLGKGVMALVSAIGLMLAFIWFRFGLTFGVGAIIALTHDVILTFGLFALTGMEFTLTAVAAILTIIGYSINDKVVVLDRIRENLRKFKRMPFNELIDLSINETLGRTIITGVTGVMALAVMAAFGGDALYGFSVSMIFGIVIGTYSSIFIAAPAMRYLYGRAARRPNRKAPLAHAERQEG
jgi:SecD/SecF fusion protein